jgi:hypothetical protein
MEEKLCLDCGRPINVGRKDKKFCDDSCRTNYNNNREKPPQDIREISIPEFVKGINDVLFNNRRMLEECLGDKENCRIKSRELDGRGFRFKFYTSCDITRKGEEYYFCYDLGYKEVEDGSLVVVRRPREAIY